MTIEPIANISSWITLLGFLIGLPTLAATYYEAWKTRKEAEEARRPFIVSENCLEFVGDDGGWVNLVPLETIRTLPRPGDVVMLPGDGVAAGAGAYRVESVEFIYAREDDNALQPRQARLTKTVAHVTNLLEGF